MNGVNDFFVKKWTMFVVELKRKCLDAQLYHNKDTFLSIAKENNHELPNSLNYIFLQG